MKLLVKSALNKASSAKARRFFTRILKDWKHFMLYLRSQGHPMTNNPAEESLRSLVIARKLCFGSRSEYGKKWRAKVHSLVETLHRQGRSILDFLTEFIAAYRRPVSHPSPCSLF